MSDNPFHSRWYRAFHVATIPLRPLGIYPTLVRCRWTKAHCRIGLSWDPMAFLGTATLALSIVLALYVAFQPWIG